MQAYTESPAVNKPDVLTLQPYQPRARKVVGEWVTRALAQVQPWQWTLGARLGRTWHRNPNHDQGQHSKERGEREAQLARDLARLRQTREYADCQRLPWRLRASYLAVLAQVHRLTRAGTWCQPRQHIHPATGEVTAVLYLPEDTWSAQTALTWCVALLDRLWLAVPRMTEKTTPRYRPGATTTRSEGHDGPEKVGDWLARYRARWCGPPGAQPELPATS